MHTHTLEASEYLPEVGKAMSCSISANHTPAPLRFIWHHILPKSCGGTTVAANLASLCDNCHYAIHALMYELKANGKITPSRKNGKLRMQYAQQGYDQAVAAGTVAHIPNEGSVEGD